MANPNYALLLAQIAAETDPTIKAQLEAQCYVFLEPLTDAERELFEFTDFDYIEDNPGYIEGFGVAQLYVTTDYVDEGYINTIDADNTPYFAIGYAVAGYVQNVDTNNESGYSSYVGVYFNDNGERT